MTNKIYYLPTLTGLVRVVSISGNVVTLTGVKWFYDDTKTTRSRQSIPKSRWDAMKKQRVAEKDLGVLSFLVKDEHTNSYRTTAKIVDEKIPGAKTLPLAPGSSGGFSHRPMSPPQNFLFPLTNTAARHGNWR
jgi:hypothetical protein